MSYLTFINLTVLASFLLSFSQAPLIVSFSFPQTLSSSLPFLFLFLLVLCASPQPTP